MAVLASSKMAGKVILVFALAATDVALERVLKAMAAHVNRIQNVVCKVHITVLAVMQELGVLHRQGRGRGARLTVTDAGGAGMGTTLTAWPCHWAIVPL